MIVHCNRSCNSCAHDLARSIVSWDLSQSVTWSDPLPDFVNNLVVHNFAEAVKPICIYIVPFVFFLGFN